jgi:hypothetical protein
MQNSTIILYLSLFMGFVGMLCSSTGACIGGGLFALAWSLSSLDIYIHKKDKE